jgi:hypothetical protein
VQAVVEAAAAAAVEAAAVEAAPLAQQAFKHLRVKVS